MSYLVKTLVNIDLGLKSNACMLREDRTVVITVCFPTDSTAVWPQPPMNSYLWLRSPWGSGGREFFCLFVWGFFFSRGWGWCSGSLAMTDQRFPPDRVAFSLSNATTHYIAFHSISSSPFFYLSDGENIQEAPAHPCYNHVIIQLKTQSRCSLIKPR